MKGSKQKMILLIPGFILFIVAFFAFLSIVEKAPGDLGLRDGHLKEVPTSPNCVSSFADLQDSVHYIEPLVLRSSEDFSQIKDLLLKNSQNKLVKEEGSYLHFECRTKFFKYTDDLEIYLDLERELIHFRSASRIGHSDFGVNRKRVEQIKASMK